MLLLLSYYIEVRLPVLIISFVIQDYLLLIVLILPISSIARIAVFRFEELWVPETLQVHGTFHLSLRMIGAVQCARARPSWMLPERYCICYGLRFTLNIRPSG